MAEDAKGGGVLADLTQHLGGIFRHMLPGILVVGAGRLAYPEWFVKADFGSWQHLIVLAAVTLAVGNAWFALNRYGFHQLIDWALWRGGYESPAKRPTSKSYVDDLGQYAAKSLHVPDSSARAQQHVAFRASIVLLVLTLAELAILVGVCHSAASPFAGHSVVLWAAGLVLGIVGVWQMSITRRIDHYVVTRS